MSDPRPRVLVCDPIAEDGVEVLRATCDVDVITGQTPDELKERIGAYDALVVRSETRVSAEQLEVASRLRVIGRAGVGVDNIDVAAATRRGVLVVNAPAGNTIAAAEHTVAMMMALARHIPQANRSLLEGKWDRKSFMGFQLRGKTLGVVGLGAIGSEVAKRPGAGDGGHRVRSGGDSRAGGADQRRAPLRPPRPVRSSGRHHCPRAAGGGHQTPLQRGAAHRVQARGAPAQRGARRDLRRGRGAGGAGIGPGGRGCSRRLRGGATSRGLAPGPPSPGRGHPPPRSLDRGGPTRSGVRRRGPDRGHPGRGPGALGGQRPHRAARGDARAPALPGAG